MKPSEMWEGSNSSLKKTYDEATYTATPKIPKDQQQIYDWGYKAGRDSMKEEIIESNIDYLKKICWSEKDIEMWLRQYEPKQNKTLEEVVNQVKEIIKKI